MTLESENLAIDREKRDKFFELAERRTQAVLEKLRVLGNCSNRQAYEYSEADVEKIFDAIDEQVRLTKARFEDRKRSFRLR